MISVVIPVWNGEAYVGAAIESVLAQTLAPGQIVVVDDGSTDATGAAVRRYEPRVELHLQPHQGPGAARNRGIAAASGDLLAFLDADDVWLPDKLALQTRALEEDPGLDLVFCHMDQFRSPELAPEVAATLACDPTPQASPLISCLLARRTDFERLGPLRTDTKAEFVDWFLRAQEAGLRMRTLPDLLVRRRLHPGNLTRLHKEVRQQYLSVVKAALDRRRLKQTGG